MNYKIYTALSLVIAIVHFILETVWHFFKGQYLPMLIVDYIAVGLLFYSYYESKRNVLFSNALFLGAWGFTFCLFYRALFYRLELIQESVTSLNATTFYVGTLMLLSAVMFMYGASFSRKNSMLTRVYD